MRTRRSAQAVALPRMPVKAAHRISARLASRYPDRYELRGVAQEIRRTGRARGNHLLQPRDSTGRPRRVPARVICIPASEMADQWGSAKVANIALLGALLEETEALSSETAMRVIEAKVKNPTLLEIDRKALQAGHDFIDNHVRIGAVTQPDGFAY